MTDERAVKDVGFLVDKASGVTSHDVVQAARRSLALRKIGHTGTLDPFATGLLVLCTGRATRLARFLTGLSKSYDARVRFGYATDTYDGTGRAEAADTGQCPREEELVAALDTLRGRQVQEPPPFSAKKIQGRRAYALARAGVEVKPAPVEVEIHEIALVALDPPFAELRLRVSSGTYVRSVAHDLGRSFGMGAHLDALRRTAIGSLRVEEAVSIDALSPSAPSPRFARARLEPSELLRDLPALQVGPEEAEALSHGRSAPATEAAPPAGPFRVVDPRGHLVAVCEVRDAVRRPLVVWMRGSENP